MRKCGEIEIEERGRDRDNYLKYKDKDKVYLQGTLLLIFERLL